MIPSSVLNASRLSPELIEVETLKMIMAAKQPKPRLKFQPIPRFTLTRSLQRVDIFASGDTSVSIQRSKKSQRAEKQTTKVSFEVPSSIPGVEWNFFLKS